MTNYHAANLRIKIAAEARTMATTRFIVGFSRKIIVPATNEVRRVTTATAGKRIEPCDFAVDSRIEFGGNARRRVTQRDEQKRQIYHSQTNPKISFFA